MIQGLMAEDLAPPLVFPDDSGLPAKCGCYLVHQGCLSIEKDGEPQHLCNFVARIREEILIDDGESEECFFILEGETSSGARFPTIQVSAASFPSLSWTITQWGASAIVAPGVTTKDKLRAAIQYLSRPSKRRVFLNTGWRKNGENWCFFHAGGVIGPNGTVDKTGVDLKGRHALYELPAPLRGEVLSHAWASSLKMLNLGPASITVPIWLSAFRAAIDECPFSIHLSGSKGGGKTELACIATGHFGSQLNAKNPLESWESTTAALERSLFLAKDVLGLVDDFRPQGSPREVAELNKKADRVLRGAYNRASRGRLASDAKTQRNAYWSRGLILSTGEDLPDGESLRSRVICLEWPLGSMDWNLMNVVQLDRAKGLHAGLMAAFIQWQAVNREEILKRRRNEHEAACRRLREAGNNNRTGDIAADLWTAWPILRSFIQEKGLLSTSELDGLDYKIWNAILEATVNQADIIRDADPAERFRAGLTSCLASGKGYLEHGDHGLLPEIWGHRCGWHGGRPQGPCLGFIAPSRKEVWLIPEAAFQEVGRLVSISIRMRALWKKMAESGWLVLERAKYNTSRRRNANLPPPPSGVDDRESFIVLRMDCLWQSSIEPLG